MHYLKKFNNTSTQVHTHVSESVLDLDNKTNPLRSMLLYLEIVNYM